jgi:hypothetical protein
VSWLGWLALVIALLAMFVVWDVVFCGSRYCARAAEDTDHTRDAA